MFRKLLGPLLISVLVVAACAPGATERTDTVLGARGTVAPGFEVLDEGTSVTRFDPPGTGSMATLVIAYRVTNDNPFDVIVDSLEYSASIEGRPVGSGTRQVGVTVGANGARDLAFTLQASLGGNPDLLRAVARSFGGRPLAIRIEGRARFLSEELGSSGRTNFRLEGAARSSDEVRAPLIEFVRADSGAFVLQPAMPVVRIVLMASNPGDIGYFLHSKDLRLVSDGVVLAMQDLLPTPIAAHSDSRIELLFYPQQSGLDEEQLRLLSDLLSTEPGQVSVQGELFMDVLGVDTFIVPGGLQAEGALSGN